MILPPFFGANTAYDEDSIKEVIIDYVAMDALTFIDQKTFASATYLAMDAVSLPPIPKGLSMTYVSMDICTFDDPGGS